jgi:hypothetical protein
MGWERRKDRMGRGKEEKRRVYIFISPFLSLAARSISSFLYLFFISESTQFSLCLFPRPGYDKTRIIRSSKFNTPRTCVLCWHSPSYSCLLWRLPPRLTSVQTSVFSAKLSQLRETTLDNAPPPPSACRSPGGITVPVEADTGELEGSRQETLVCR